MPENEIETAQGIESRSAEKMSAGETPLRGECHALPDTFCDVPWLNLSIDVDGSVRPCCMFTRQNEAAAAEFGNLKSASLAEVWNSQGMVNLRREFLAGKKPQSCQKCWNEEAAGIASYRQTFKAYRVPNAQIDFADLNPTQPLTLDLKLTNRCNLKCRICSPLASSLALSEAKLHRSEPTDFLSWLEREETYFLSNKITRHEVNLETFRRWLPGIEQIELFGGETIISDEINELEDLIVAEGHAEHITLLFNTNASIFSPQGVERWKQFRRVTICLSIDDIERRFEYQRHPAQWSKVQENLQKYHALHELNFFIYLFCSVSAFNVYYLPEIVDWMDRRLPCFDIILNYVHYDPHFCVTQLPDRAKTVVCRRLLAAADDMDARRCAAVDSPFVKAALGNRLREAAAFVASRDSEPLHWQEFLRKAEQFDRIRGESFAAVFPEFAQLLSSDA